jgi:tRNA(Arg) A34 adenosine deaminase TadA
MKPIEPTLSKQQQGNSAFSDQDQNFMLRALKIAKKGRFTTSPNPNVGCVLVDYQQCAGVIIGEGYHQKAGSAHAEINALNAAKKKLSEPNKGLYCLCHIGALQSLWSNSTLLKSPYRGRCWSCYYCDG